MYTANQIYAMPALQRYNTHDPKDRLIFTSELFKILSEHNYWSVHTLEFVNNAWEYQDPRVHTEQKAYFMVDHRRYAECVAVYFDDHPIMLYWQGGREGRDSKYHIITCSPEFWEEFLDYLLTIPQVIDRMTPTFTDPEKQDSYHHFYVDDIFADDSKNRG